MEVKEGIVLDREGNEIGEPSRAGSHQPFTNIKVVRMNGPLALLGMLVFIAAAVALFMFAGVFLLVLPLPILLAKKLLGGGARPKPLP